MKLIGIISLIAAVVLLTLGVPFVASLILDSSGRAAIGTVTGKTEQIKEKNRRAAIRCRRTKKPNSGIQFSSKMLTEGCASPSVYISPLSAAEERES